MSRVSLTLSLFVVLTIVGCSSYRPNGTVVTKDKLAEYNPKHFAKNELLSSSVKPFKNEDELIMRAIWYEQQGDFKHSNEIYDKLYKETHNPEYLAKESMTALYAGGTSKNIVELKAYAEQEPNNLKIQRLLLSSLLNEKKYKEAKELAQRLIEISHQALDYELGANPYIYTADYKEATKLLKKAYEKTLNEDILIKISILLGNYLNDIPQALEVLEEYRENQGCGKKVCLQLLDIYGQQNDLEKVISVYESLYRETKEEMYAEKLVEAYLYNKEYTKAVEFLKHDYENKALLYALYIEKKEYAEALELAKLLAVETRDPKWYAEAAMALFEGTGNKDDKSMLGEVVNLFEKSLKSKTDNPLYLNYYGYTLIDKEIDIPKGMSIVQKALKMEAENSYYLDSLAWGYYKLNECGKAYNIMKKVVDIEGLKEEELVEHWNAISKKCKR